MLEGILDFVWLRSVFLFFPLAMSHVRVSVSNLFTPGVYGVDLKVGVHRTVRKGVARVSPSRPISSTYVSFLATNYPQMYCSPPITAYHVSRQHVGCHLG
jgi:hypothetical protein